LASGLIRIKGFEFKLELIVKFTALAVVGAAFYAFWSSVADFNGTTALAAPENNPPVVRILDPKNNSVHSANSLIRYSISVSDKEDGESKFDEIQGGKIFLEIRFVERAQQGKKLALVTEPPGLVRIKRSDCFSCHQFHNRLIGPSFTEIAARYAENQNAGAILAGRILGGSQNVWGEAVMPAHSDLSEKSALQIADWIMKAGLDKSLNYLSGKEGAFRPLPPDKVTEGYFQLTASYTDNGVPGQPGDALTGQDVVIIRFH
jgi:cytochrome c